MKAVIIDLFVEKLLKCLSFLCLFIAVKNSVAVNAPIFSLKRIHEIYERVVKKDISYFKKYEILPLSMQEKWSWSGHDFPRVWCFLDFNDWIKKYQINPISSLAVTCLDDPELKFLSYKKITKIVYNPATEIGDLHTLKCDEKFDFFLFNQTLEHLYNPFLAVSKIFSVLNDGGWVFTSVPTINIPHDTPIHFYGYTPMGLVMLFISCGFEVKEVGQFGNYEYISKIFKNHKWPDYRELENPDTKKISNEELNVAQCWILAQKPIKK